MTWILSFLGSWWREVAIALLLSGLALSIKVGNSVRVEYEADKVKWSIQVAQAEAAQKEVEVRSQKTLETINANHSKLLVAAQANAQTNYSRLLAQFAARGASFGMRYPATLPTTTGDTAEGTATFDAAVSSVMVDPEARLVRDCAATANQVDEWQEWARLNHLPVE